MQGPRSCLNSALSCLIKLITPNLGNGSIERNDVRESRAQVG
jgi:hypothetical protein